MRLEKCARWETVPHSWVLPFGSLAAEPCPASALTPAAHGSIPKPGPAHYFKVLTRPALLDKTARHTARLSTTPFAICRTMAIQFRERAFLTSAIKILVDKTLAQVEMRGLEPLTSALQRRRSPS